MTCETVKRRNLTDGWKIELALGNKADLAEIGRVKMSEAQVGIPKTEIRERAGTECPTTFQHKVREFKAMAGRDKQLGVLSKNDRTPAPKHNTQQEVAKVAQVSTGKVAMAEVVMTHC